MKTLVTGCNGFAARHAIAALQNAGHEVIGGDLTCAPNAPFHAVELDLRDRPSLTRAIATTDPEAILHLGGIAFVPVGWTDPQLVFTVNTVGTLNLLEAIQLTRRPIRTLIVTSAEVYGSHPAPTPLTENSPYRPDNIYGIAKAAADHASLLYARHHHLDVIIARPSNHIGPGQSKDFVSSAFATQLAAIAAGAPPVIRVGNLEQRRDFTDVRDVARAYTRLLEHGKPQTAYNIASGKMIPVRLLLEGLCTAAQIHPQVIVDPNLFRPNEDRPSYDISRIHIHVDWKPEIPLAQTLADIYQKAQYPTPNTQHPTPKCGKD